MFAHRGIEVSSVVRLEASCDISHEIHADELHLELGPAVSSLYLTITEEAARRLSEVFAQSMVQFRELERLASVGEPPD